MNLWDDVTNHEKCIFWYLKKQKFAQNWFTFIACISMAQRMWVWQICWPVEILQNHSQQNCRAHWRLQKKSTPWVKKLKRVFLGVTRSAKLFPSMSSTALLRMVLRMGWNSPIYQFGHLKLCLSGSFDMLYSWIVR